MRDPVDMLLILVGAIMGSAAIWATLTMYLAQ
jgi:hypothetical protein